MAPPAPEGFLMDAVTALRSYGMGLADELVRAAQAEGIELAAAAAIISMESNGRNVWGSDPVSTGGAYTKGGPVTQANYLAYRALVKAGKIGRQGVGPAQCTSAGYQDTADALGGCWDPLANYRSGFRGLQRLIAAYGLRDGARRYNGSGPAAERYADTFMARYTLWHSRLSGAVVPPLPNPDGDDELNADQNAMLTGIYHQMSGSPNVGQWPGWPTWDGGTGESLTLLDYLRRNNERMEKLEAKLDALTTKLEA